jgi:hypothetical protein
LGPSPDRENQRSPWTVPHYISERGWGSISGRFHTHSGVWGSRAIPGITPGRVLNRFVVSSASLNQHLALEADGGIPGAPVNTHNYCRPLGAPFCACASNGLFPKGSPQEKVRRRALPLLLMGSPGRRRRLDPQRLRPEPPPEPLGGGGRVPGPELVHLRFCSRGLPLSTRISASPCTMSPYRRADLPKGTRRRTP